jgi:hypothetical protein
VPRHIQPRQTIIPRILILGSIGEPFTDHIFDDFFGPRAILALKDPMMLAVRSATNDGHRTARQKLGDAAADKIG